jgi:hypothetical protein
MSRKRVFCECVVAAAFAALPALAHADDSTHVGLAVTGGLSGVGADLGVNINRFVGARASVAGISVSHNGDYGTSVSWDARLKLFQTGLLIDGYPFAGGFHLTAGMVRDGNKFTLNGQPTASTFTFNGNAYPSSAVPSAAASVEWNKTVPYLGLGWGNLAGATGLHFTTDMGVLITGRPTSTIAVACNAAALQGTPYTCASLASDVAQEQAKLQNDVHRLRFWPVLRFGMGWAF